MWMFDTFIVQPIFNLLVLIYAAVPGADLGIAIILFTIVVRLLMWPLLRKQLHQTRLMRQLQPQIKEIKRDSKGDRQLEAKRLMDLYKENGVNAFAAPALLLVQLPVFIGLFSALRRLIDDKQNLVDFTYSWVRDIGKMKDVVNDLSLFDNELFGLVDMKISAWNEGSILWGAMAIAVAAGVFQYIQNKQLLSDRQQGETKKIGQILREASEGKEADQSEINAAVAGKMAYLFAPLITFISAVSPAGLALYFATGGLVAIAQQRVVFNQDIEEMQELARQNGKAKQAKKDAKNGSSNSSSTTSSASKSSTTKTTTKKTTASGRPRKKTKG